MQSVEFDKLIAGEQSKWAFLTEEQQIKWNEMMSTLNPASEQREIKTQLKEEIKENEVPIPCDINAEIQRFIKTERKRGTTERAIRRMVKRKWNIYVVK